MSEEKQLFCADRQQWRGWLEKNHARAGEAWLVYYKAGGRKGISRGETLDEALRFGWIDGKIKRLDEERYMVRYTPRRPGSRWSLANRTRAEELIESGLMTPAGLKTVDEAKKNGLWDKAYSIPNAADIKVPPDLESALKQDQAAWENFQAFSRSSRNTYIRYISDVKSEEARGRRIARVVERAAENRKPGMDM